MFHPSNEKEQEPALYDSMTTMQLEHILRADAQANEEDQLDSEALLYIMEILAKRRNGPGGDDRRARKAWQNFQDNYHPGPSGPFRKSHMPFRSTWVRRAAALAAALVLLVGIPAVSLAFDRGAHHGTIATCEDELFCFKHFISSLDMDLFDGTSESSGSITEMLGDHGRRTDLMPTWLPEGFELWRTKLSVSDFGEHYRSLYMYGEEAIVLSVKVVHQQGTGGYCIDEHSQQLYRHDDTDYHIFTNGDRLCAIWLDGDYECCITGDVTVKQMKTMLHSIERNH